LTSKFGQDEWEKARELYERLLQRTGHVKVSIYGNCAHNHCRCGLVLPPLKSQPKIMAIKQHVCRSAATFMSAPTLLSSAKASRKSARCCLSHGWKWKKLMAPETRERVSRKMPKVVKKRRRVEDEAGAQTATWEEYYDYIFPDDEVDKPNFKLLQMAHEWKAKMAAMQAANGGAEEADAKEEESDSSGSEDEND
jgi:crooked neck